MTLPPEGILALTFRCNSKCAMCDIWQQPVQAELEPEHYAVVDGTKGASEVAEAVWREVKRRGLA